MTWHDTARSFAEQATGKFFVAAATPSTSRGEVQFDSCETYFAELVGRGADGLAVGVHTGRGQFLERDERLRLVAAASDLGVLTLTGVQGRDVEFDTAFARDAAQVGADALLVPLLADEPAGALRYLDALWDASGLPLILFDAYFKPYPIDSFSACLDHAAVAGAKSALLFDAIACQDKTALVRASGKLAITGEDRMFGASLMWGAQCALVGLGAAATELSRDAFRNHRDGNFEEFVAASNRLDEFASTIFSQPYDGYVQRMLWVAAEERLIPHPHASDNYGPPLAADEHDRIRRLVKDLGLGLGKPVSAA